MQTGFLNIGWQVWAAAATLLGVLWVFVWPRRRVSPTTPAWIRWALRWAHPLTWFLLGISFWLRGGGLPRQADLAAFVGLLAYLAFLAALAASRRYQP
jgi:hypothetical protein